jgi:hypothetical protein
MTRNDYPQLTDLGILNPLQIDRYQVNSIANHDILRVIYERGKDSFLPSTRTYKFPRVQKNAVIDAEKKSVLEELQALEDEIEMRASYIRELVKQLGAV